MSVKNKALPYVAAVIAAVAWGFSFLFTKDSLTYLQPFQLLGYRFGVAAAFMALLAAVGVLRVRLTKEKLKAILPVSLLSPVLYFPCETFGIKLTSATESGIIISLVPMAIMLFSALLLGERLTALKWVFVAVCVSGVVLIALAGSVNMEGSLVGVLCLLGAVAAAGLYSPLSRKASEKSTPVEITFVMMLAGAAVFNLIGLTSFGGNAGGYFDKFADLNVLGGVAYLGLLCSVVAFICMNYALSKLETTVTGTFINLVPFVSLFAGVVVGSERLGPLQIAGAALILLGIWGTARKKAGDTPDATLPLPPE